MRLLTIIITALLFGGCNMIDEGQTAESSFTTKMQLNTDYELYEGDKIVRDSSDATVAINKNSEKAFTTVTLTSGDGHIIWHE